MTKNVLRYGLMVVALTFVIGAGSASAQINQIYDKIDAHHKALASLEASVLMAKYNSQVDDTDRQSGKVWYVPAKGKDDMYIRIDWTQPAKETMVVYKGQYRIYRERLNQGYEGPVDKAKNNASASGPLAFLSMNRKQLRENYTAEYVGKEVVAGGKIPTSRIKLTPKDQSKYKLAELWVDVDGMPVQAKVVSANGDTTTVLLTGVVKNQIKDGSIFNFKFPAGTKIVKE